MSWGSCGSRCGEESADLLYVGWILIEIFQKSLIPDEGFRCWGFGGVVFFG